MILLESDFSVSNGDTYVAAISSLSIDNLPAVIHLSDGKGGERVFKQSGTDMDDDEVAGWRYLAVVPRQGKPNKMLIIND